MDRGLRESQWLVMRRCLAIVRRVQRGPAHWDELLEAVLTQVDGEAYGEGDETAKRKRLENDLARIRDKLGIDLFFDREAGGYVIRDAWLPLLDLPTEDLATLAWLEETFGPGSPQHDEVQALLGRLRLYLSPERRGEIERCHTELVVDLEQRDQDRIVPGVWEGLTRGLAERRRIEFLYVSPQQADGTARRHVVDPYERYFDTVRGHYYLHGWCYYSVGPKGRWEHNAYFDYRLGRIYDVQVLPDKLPPCRPHAHRYTVEYELAPQVARLGVSRQRGIEIVSVERQPDGSAVVRGESTDLFAAVQSLLHYGANCRVLGGPQALARMRAVVRRMAEVYGSE